MEKRFSLFQPVRRRLAVKMILAFSGVMALMMLSLILISYYRNVDILETDFVSNNVQILDLVNKNVDDYMGQIDELSLSFRKYDRFESYMMSPPEERAAYDTYLQELVKNLFYSRADIEEVRFFTPRDRQMLIMSHLRPNVRSEDMPGFMSIPAYTEAVRPRFFRSMERGTGTVGADAAGSVFMTFTRAIINISDARVLGVVSLSMNDKSIEQILRNAITQEGEQLMLTDSQGGRLYPVSEPEGVLSQVDFRKAASGLEAGESLEYQWGGKSYLALANTSARYGIRLVKLIPKELVNRRAEQTRNLSVTIGLLLGALMILVVYITATAITTQLRRLSRTMDKVAGGRFDQQVRVKGEDEVARLSQAFNAMVFRIDELINDQYRSRLRENNARLKALEAQINPHFLYNALQAISTRALLSGARDVRDMIESLAFTMRYCFRGSDRVRLEEEMIHVRHYLVLHQARFEDRLQVTIHEDEGTGERIVPRLSVQTLVENAVRHALENMAGQIHIRISAQSGNGFLNLSVEDDGPGIPPERLAQLRTWLEDPEDTELADAGIGLRNLQSRLRLMFGPEAGLVITTGDQGGTRVEIRIPEEQEETSCTTF